MNSIDEKRTAYQRQVDYALRQLAVLDRFPTEDPYEDEAVLSFKYRYRDGSGLYTFAAIRINGFWWLTGRSRGPYSWKGLVNFWADGEIVNGVIWEVTEWGPSEL